MLKDLEVTIDKFSNLKERCADNGEHDIRAFRHDGKESNFENICYKCGGYEVNRLGIRRHFAGLMHYFDSERYNALVKKSERIKTGIGKPQK